MKKNQGFTLVEVLISATIILVAVVSLIGVHSLYLRTALSNNEAIQAAYLAEEGIEAVRFWRNSSWSANIASVSLNTPYGLSFNGTSWATTSSESIGNFSRTITLSVVERNASSDIVSTGGTIDTDTVLVTSAVSWMKGGATTTKAISTYLTNLYGN